MRDVTLVMSGGGMRGLAHVGVLKVMEALELRVAEVYGTSVGGLVGALVAGGMSLEELEEVARGLKRDDLLDFNYGGLIKRRTRMRSIYRGKRFREWVKKVLPVKQFSELKLPLQLNAVDLNTGRGVYWGTNGQTKVSLADAVCATCSLPGAFPPMNIGGNFYLDGSVHIGDPLERALQSSSRPVVAVYLQTQREDPTAQIERQGVISVLAQAHTIMSRTLLERTLDRVEVEENVIVIRPKVEFFGFFDFEHSAELINEGLRAAMEVLPRHPALTEARPRRFRFPRRTWGTRSRRFASGSPGFASTYQLAARNGR